MNDTENKYYNLIHIKTTNKLDKIALFYRKN